MHSRPQSQSLSTDPPAPPRPNVPSLAAPPHAKRPRAPSDPFLDTPPLSHSYTSSSTQSFSGNTAVPLSASVSDTAVEPPSPVTPPAEIDDVFSAVAATQDYQYCETDEAYLRIWTSPNLPNLEILELLRVFPTFVSRRTFPRFQVSPHRPNDLEEGIDDDDQKEEIRVGTGRMWVSTQERSPGWEGGWWTQFKLWVRRLFC